MLMMTSYRFSVQNTQQETIIRMEMVYVPNSETITKKKEIFSFFHLLFFSIIALLMFFQY
jgi:hypothetical protein